MREPSSIHPQRLIQVFQSVGYAVLQAQTVEDALGVHLALVYDLQPDAARQEAESVLSAYSSQNLGILLKTARKKPSFPAHLAADLDEFKSQRNWLIHRSRPDQRSATKSDAATAAFCERVTELGGLAADLQARIQRETEAHLLALGFARDGIEAQAKRIFAEWYGT